MYLWGLSRGLNQEEEFSFLCVKAKTKHFGLQEIETQRGLSSKNLSLTHIMEKLKSLGTPSGVAGSSMLTGCPCAPSWFLLLSAHSYLGQALRQGGPVAPGSRKSASSRREETPLPQESPKGGRPQREKHPQDPACQKDGMKV